jgi:hypothetical protein
MQGFIKQFNAPCTVLTPRPSYTKDVSQLKPSQRGCMSPNTYEKGMYGLECNTTARKNYTYFEATLECRVPQNSSTPHLLYLPRPSYTEDVLQLCGVSHCFLLALVAPVALRLAGKALARAILHETFYGTRNF